MIFKIPNLSLVVLVGASGSGKSSFARKHFLPTEIVSSDVCRGLVSDDENSQAATPAAFELLHFTIEQRLKLGRLTVVDATNVQGPSRKKLVELARKYHAIPVAIAFKLPAEICLARNAQRPDRQFGPHVVRNQTNDLFRSLGSLRKEGFRSVSILGRVEDIDDFTIVREPLWNDQRQLNGPFDIIGDIHGCFDELQSLLGLLGYDPETGEPPAGRTAIFLGDLVDRGPKSPEVLHLVMSMQRAGHALCVPGNHDIKLMRYLKGGDIKLTHGLDLTIEQLSHEPESFRQEVANWIDSLVSHYVLDQGKLVVAHAGMPESMQGRGSGRVREFALYGETTGETDEFGLPVRYAWAQDYRGAAAVVYGHTPVPEPEWLNNTLCLDTGCVFGGKLSALRYPEREIVSVVAEETYAIPARPLVVSELSSQHETDDVLEIGDVRRRMHLSTALAGVVVIAEENATAALEVMSRFAANPKWLVYLPPTMSPSETSAREGFLEYPTEAFDYFRNQGIERVVAEEKHMGSRAVVIVGRDEDVIRRRFGIVDEGIGTILTRTGRRFFEGADLEQALLQRLVSAADRSGLWEQLTTDWLVIDAELMPWSAKAQQLIRTTYAPVGVSGVAAFGALGELLVGAKTVLPDNEELAHLAFRAEARRQGIHDYVCAYERYCWPVRGLEDYKLAPFHILASEGAVHHERDHEWHMSALHRLCQEDPGVLRATPYRIVDLVHDTSVESATNWWLELTGEGGEGMVVKPYDFTVKQPKALVQPALKCRGPEYLRIIYGPEYRLPENLGRLRTRGLARKRALARREFALGIEALTRFVAKEPLRRVHECVFGILALESEPVDPRL
jgi:protein phosphatase